MAAVQIERDLSCFDGEVLHAQADLAGGWAPLEELDGIYNSERGHLLSCPKHLDIYPLATASEYSAEVVEIQHRCRSSPNLIGSPALSVRATTGCSRASLTQVPLRLPKSRAHQRAPSQNSAACSPDTPLPGSTRSAPVARPTIVRVDNTTGRPG